jgi:hypothetical protein
VRLNALVVNGDHQEVAVTAPDGQAAVATTVWQRDQHYPPKPSRRGANETASGRSP